MSRTPWSIGEIGRHALVRKSSCWPFPGWLGYTGGVTHPQPRKDFGSPANRNVDLDPSVFYVCQRCTRCCKWPGDVRIEEEEISPIAEFLGLTEEEFIERFTRLRSNRQGLSLIEKANHECIMLDGNACRIHPVKPAQCAGFPNKWNFPGWRQVCEAIPVPFDSVAERIPD